MADLTESQRQQINDEIFAGRRIHAVKLYREYTNTELSDAKVAVDNIADELRKQFPEKVPNATGCGATAMLFLVVALVIWFVI